MEKLRLAFDLLVCLLGRPSDSLTSQSAEHQCLLIRVNDLCELVPDTSETRLVIAATSPEELDVGSLVGRLAHYEQGDTFSARRHPVVYASRQLAVCDQEDVVLSEHL